GETERIARDVVARVAVAAGASLAHKRPSRAAAAPRVRGVPPAPAAGPAGRLAPAAAGPILAISPRGAAETAAHDRGRRPGPPRRVEGEAHRPLASQPPPPLPPPPREQRGGR